MKNINGTHYITVKEYAELKSLTVGRIYQLKGELPFEKFDDLGVELINLDLLKLSEKESSLAHTKFQTSHALHTYDYKQLGLFVAEMLKTSNEARSNAETLLREKDLLLAEKRTLVEALTDENKELTHDLSEAVQQKDISAQSLRDATEQIQTLGQDLSLNKSEYDKLAVEHQSTIQALQELRVIQQQQQSDYDLKVLENQGLTNEINLYKSQVLTLTNDVAKGAETVALLEKNYRDMVIQKEAITQELTAAKSIAQQSSFDYEIKLVEVQGLVKENSLYKNQIESLTKSLESGKGFDERLDKLEKIITQIPKNKPSKAEKLS